MPYAGNLTKNTPRYSAQPQPSVQNFSRPFPITIESSVDNTDLVVKVKRSPNRVSQKLHSLICKFEALDGLSLHFETPSFLSDPLQASRKKFRKRGGTRSSQTSDPSTTLCHPGRRSTDKGDSTDSQDTGTVMKERLADVTDPTIWNSSEKNIGNSTKSSAGERGSLEKSRTESQAIGNPLPSSNLSIESAMKIKICPLREKISFYDGGMSTADTTGARPSLYTPLGPEPPMADNHLQDSSNRFCTSGQDATFKLVSGNKAPDLISPDKTRSSPENKQHLVIDPKFDDPVLPAHNPYPTAEINISQPITSYVKPPGQARMPFMSQKEAFHPLGRDPEFNRNSKPRISVVVRDNIVTDRERSHKKHSSPARVVQGSIDPQIEELYVEKSMEPHQKVDKFRTPPRVLSSPPLGPLNPVAELAILKSEKHHPKPKESKVASMKRMFEESRKSQFRCLRTSPTKQTLVSEEAKKSRTIQSVAPPHQPPRPQDIVKGSEPVSPRTVDVHPVLVQPDGANKDPPAPGKRPAQRKGKLIGDKVKQFESRGLFLDGEPPPRRLSIAGKINRSLKGLFEPRRSSEEAEQARQREIVAKDIEGILDEFQEQSRQVTPIQTSSLVGRWDESSPSPSDETKNMMLPRISISDEDDGLVVKEAECGLRQPKPLRATEMKRMMLLCREKVGSISKASSTRGNNL